MADIGVSEPNTIISMPDSPEELGITLPPAEFRRIDFSALDFETIRRLAYEYTKTYYPNDFNDFVLSNGVMMIYEIVSAITNVLSERSDIVADESFLSTALSRTAVSQHLELIGQSLGRATSAVVDVECSLGSPIAYDVNIPAGLSFSVTGPNGSEISYELFRSPGDYTSNIVIPRGKRGIIAFAVEGSFGSDIEVVSNGESNQFIDILQNDVLNTPIMVYISSGEDTIKWNRIDFIEKALANDQVYEVRHLDDRTRIIFGDNSNGKSPIDGQIIRVRYRTGGGIKGRIGSGAINETRPISSQNFATASVIFRNLNPSRGGQDNESLEAAKKRAPREFSVHDNIATADDYAIMASQFSHPVYGIVSKAVATIRSGIESGDPSEGDNNLDTIIEAIRAASTSEEAKEYLLTNYVNKNIVEMYILAEGEDIPIAPSKGLKESLKTSLSDKNVFTDELRIYDGKLLPVDIEAVIVINRNADAGAVKEKVLYEINQLFNISNRNMGEGFNRSDIIYIIKNVDGVKSIDLFKPVDDYPPLRKVVTRDEREENIQGVGVNELIILGQQNIQFYLEQGNLNL